LRISILAYDGCMGAEVFGFADIMLVANRIWSLRRPAEPAPFSCSIISAGRAHVTLAGGATLQPSLAQDPDLLVVPAFDFSRAGDIDRIVSRLDPELALIRRLAGRRRVASICGGAFLLAEAGVLAGRRATTAWAMAETFMRRYPNTRLEPEAMLVSDEQITTSGAFTAYADLALWIVAEQAGPSIARAVARFSLIGKTRASQAPYADLRAARGRPRGFARDVERWLSEHVAERYSLEAAAAAFGFSTRTFLRRVKQDTDKSPLEMLQAIRLEQAKRLLETTSLSVAEIAARVGYGDAPSFHRLFVRQVSITPAAYRRDFAPGRAWRLGAGSTAD